MTKLINLGRASTETKGSFPSDIEVDGTGKVFDPSCPLDRPWTYQANTPPTQDPCIPV